jgi:restriction system protein
MASPGSPKASWHDQALAQPGAFPPERRGAPPRSSKQFEAVLADLFRVNEILVREAFTLTGPGGAGIVEQIDGAVELDSHLYLVEAKWLSGPAGPPEVSALVSRLFARGEMRGLLISASRFTAAAVETAKSALAQRVIALCEVQEIVFCLEQAEDFRELLRQKVRAAMLDKNPMFRGFG